MIKAIETEYKGYRFRSRLEARWAVFFDAANIPYEYEPEGYKFLDGAAYLPDFYLPDSDLLVEVKPPRENAIKELRKAAKIVEGNKEIQGLLILPNIPPENACEIWWYPVIYYHPLRYIPLRAYLAILPDFEDNGAYIATDHWVGFQNEVVFPMCGESDLLYPVNDMDMPYTDEFRYTDFASANDGISIMRRLYNAARGARFEHGETP